ncbi:hypothetical protein [Paenibacillus lutrae]|uniref:DUF2187 domain-containing protein n=1 Tax=Paenibacillus lutrae TaxID=2078573 RepID=A0A7X3FJ04_9BACL|nr:hypothetical protein [Paenibacillus lutrae]MVP00379.1 hypothetical protein [Paenibacillus lutrae]
MLQPGDIVKHKKDKYLVRGIVRSIAKSGIRAEVDWDHPEDNPKLLWFIGAYYLFENLEKLEG